MLLGVVDETNSLRYGQVFIQLRDLDGRKQVKVNRKVLVTRNPAHFPGDIRLLDAVDCRALHHLSECIVFPAEGQRPHPNEMSGGDLDGDEVSWFYRFYIFCILFIKYWTCWSEDLVSNATKQYDPEIFDTVEKPKYPGEITMVVIAEFLFKYMSTDSHSLLSHHHLLCCDRHTPNHEYSVRLAAAISQAVDFIKTGVPAEIPKDFNFTEHPDFLEKKDGKSYQSISGIGAMYRQVKEVWNIHSTWQEQIEEQSVFVDPNLLIGGYERFVNEAKEDYQYYSSRMNTILSIYNLQTEYELITGCHLCPKEESKNNYSEKTALLEFRELCTEMQDRFAEDSLE
jgi:RNA-dependent RNA polymerase